MRLEDINDKNVKLLKDDQLKNMKEIACQLYRTSARWTDQLSKRMIGVNQPIKRDRLIEASEAIVAEIKARGLETTDSELDAKILRKAMRGIDVAELPVFLVKNTVVSLSGKFVTDPKHAESVEVRIDADELDDDFTDELEKRMVEGILDQTGLPVSVHRDAEGLESPIIVAYDLMLIPRGETIDENGIDELAKRLSDRKDFLGTGPRLAEDGYSLLYGNDWETIERADGPTIEYVEAGVKKAEKSEIQFIKNTEQRIVGGIVYCPMEIDSQDEYVGKVEDIFEGMKSWMLKGHPLHFMHNGKAVATPLIECFQATEDMTKNGQPLPAGAWYISNYIPEKLEELWQAIRNGSITGYSMSGTASVTEVEAETDEDGE